MGKTGRAVKVSEAFYNLLRTLRGPPQEGKTMEDVLREHFDPEPGPDELTDDDIAEILERYQDTDLDDDEDDDEEEDE